MMARAALLMCMVGAVQGVSKMTFTTFADGSPTGGIRQSADGEDGLDSPGDVFVFDQKLWNADRSVVVGNNAGYCVRTDPGAPDWSDTDHPTLPDDINENWAQCSWTLTFNSASDYMAGSTITVSGREASIATSSVAVVGGTMDFVGATGQLTTTPKQFNGETFFEQILTIYTRK